MDMQTLGAAIAFAKKQGGSGGTPGASAGFGTPTASATALANGEQPTVNISASGPNTAKVFDFQFGIPAGADGKTPEKGVDYYTEADKEEIVDEILGNLPSSSGLPTITEQDDGKQLYARGSEWVVEEPPCGYMGEEVLFDKEVDASSGTYTDPDFVIDIYKDLTYTVVIEDAEYHTVAKSFQGIAYLGNAALIGNGEDGAPEDTGENYFIASSMENGFMFAIRSPGTYRLKILSKKIKKIDNVFIENPVISGPAIGSQIFNFLGNIASGEYAHAEGYYTEASGVYAHTEGFHTVASGLFSHAEGYDTVASVDASHVEGYGTVAFGRNSHVQGKCNIEDNNAKYAHIVGNGINKSNRSNAHTLDWDGNTWYAGELYLGGTGQDDPETWKANLPKYTSSDNDKILKITNGVPTWAELPIYNGEVE